MTANKDLKKRIRDRQAKTGESYTTARIHVLRERHALFGSEKSTEDRITAVVLKCNEKSIRIRDLLGTDAVTLRCRSYDAWRIAPGQLVEVVLG